MRHLSQEQFNELARGSRTLSADEHGVKVLLTPSGSVIKLFRRKRWVSSAQIVPYAHRFARASRELVARGFVAPPVEMVARVPDLRRDIVIYPHQPGETLRDALARGATSTAHERLLAALAQLLAALHQRGVYFRAAHFGNFLANESQLGKIELTMIDLSEARFRRGSLGPKLRARNFRPLTRYPEDLAAVQAFGVERFVRAYMEAATLPERQATRFRSALRQVHSTFGAI